LLKVTTYGLTTVLTKTGPQIVDAENAGPENAGRTKNAGLENAEPGKCRT